MKVGPKLSLRPFLHRALQLSLTVMKEMQCFSNQCKYYHEVGHKLSVVSLQAR